MSLAHNAYVAECPFRLPRANRCLRCKRRRHWYRWPAHGRCVTTGWKNRCVSTERRASEADGPYRFETIPSADFHVDRR